MSIPEVRKRHITREHDYGRDCWCNPLVVTEGIPVLMPFTGTVVRGDPVGAHEMALHVEPTED